MRDARRDKELFSYLDGKANIKSAYTYKEFDEKTTTLAEILIGDLKIEVGTPVLLVYPPGLDFILTFIACFKAGEAHFSVYNFVITL